LHGIPAAWSLIAVDGQQQQQDTQALVGDSRNKQALTVGVPFYLQVDSVVRMIEGTAKNMGITIVD
jgi:hypothetical protein